MSPVTSGGKLMFYTGILKDYTFFMSQLESKLAYTQYFSENSWGHPPLVVKDVERTGSITMSDSSESTEDESCFSSDDNSDFVIHQRDVSISEGLRLIMGQQSAPTVESPRSSYCEETNTLASFVPTKRPVLSVRPPCFKTVTVEGLWLEPEFLRFKIDNICKQFCADTMGACVTFTDGGYTAQVVVPSLNNLEKARVIMNIHIVPGRKNGFYNVTFYRGYGSTFDYHHLVRMFKPQVEALKCSRSKPWQAFARKPQAERCEKFIQSLPVDRGE
jgi:hypothetical protein